MEATLLIDLDDTLLDNDIDVFLPAYLKLLSAELSAYADPSALVQNLLVATREMVKNRRPDCTLKEVFENAFYPALGISQEQLQEPIERFYRDVFPQLSGLTRPRSQASRLVETAFQRGYRLVIATNPLFPPAAIHHRLAWAGLPVDRYPFDLITTYDRLHFSKPHPEYYAEILGQLGWPEGPVIMIGDSYENDIQPARQLGLPAFWLNPRGAAIPEGSAAPAGRGAGLDDFLPWLDSVSPDALLPDLSSPAALLALLRATPAVLQILTRDLEEETLKARPAPGEWSITEVLCHLRDVETEVNLYRMHKIQEEENPFLPGKDTDPWAEARQYNMQDRLLALHHFTVARLRLLDWLENLPAQDWERKVRHAILGPTRVSELINIVASHDRLHIQQVRQARQRVAPRRQD